jgi:hypothetical protein
MDPYINPQAYIEAQKQKLRDEQHKKQGFPAEPQRDVLDRLLVGSPVGRTRDAAPGTPPDRPVQRLLAEERQLERQAKPNNKLSQPQLAERQRSLQHALQQLGTRARLGASRQFEQGIEGLLSRQHRGSQGSRAHPRPMPEAAGTARAVRGPGRPGSSDWVRFH